MSDRIRDRAILSRFSDALGRGEVQLYLQAQVGAGDRHVIGAEALSRWVCEDGRVIPPAVFIPILEEHGKIWQLDYHIWEMACRLLKSWKDDPVFGSYRISVNISVKDIYYLDLYEVFTHLTEEYKIDPEHLELEITETVFMDKPKEAIALIQRLKEYGFTIAIDDFGSGYSSLSFLKDIQADILKIDMEFLRKTEHQERSRIILRSIVALARELGMPTVVEGVETSQQVRDLTQIGCDIFQGFYYSRPVPVADFEERFPDGLARPWSEPVQAEK
ncbi:EAL domain-containing protein [Mitsuokella jalaludinii]